MADYGDILRIAEEIRDYVVDLPTKLLIRAGQIVIYSGLSDISESLGIIQAGEFRAGNRIEPNNGFSGMRMLYPPVMYDLGGSDEYWNLVGIEDDILQFGVRASDGKLVAGGGAVILDEDGITATGGTIAGWTINSDHLLSPGTPGIKIDSTGAIQTTDFVSGITGKGWKISEAGDAEFNNAVIRGEIRTTVLTYQEIQAVSGTMGVFLSSGVLLASVHIDAAPATAAVITIKDPPSGHAALFGEGDILRIKDGSSDTWLSVDVGGVSDETTHYEYTCTIEDGSQDCDYTAGQAVVNYGASGGGYLLMEAIGTGAPYFSVRTNDASPWDDDDIEHVRMGNLNGGWGYSSNKYGVAIGQYAEDTPNIILDEDGSLTINIYDGTTNNPVLQFDDDGSFIMNVLNMTGDNSAIAIGATPPTASNAGTGLWLDKTGIYSLKSDDYQVKIDATDGMLYAGAGDVVLNEDGIEISASYDSDYHYTNALKWMSGATSVAWLIGASYLLYQTLNIEVGSSNVYDASMQISVGLPTGDNYSYIRLNSPTWTGSFASTIDIVAKKLTLTGTGSASGKIILDEGTIYADVPVEFNYGTAALPGISFYGDANTGIYRSGSDQIGISADSVVITRTDESTIPITPCPPWEAMKNFSNIMGSYCPLYVPGTTMMDSSYLARHLTTSSSSQVALNKDETISDYLIYYRANGSTYWKNTTQGTSRNGAGWLTLLVWFKPTTVGILQGLLQFGHTTQNIAAYITTGNKLVVDFTSSGGLTQVISSNSVVLDEWNYAVLRFQGGGGTSYINLNGTTTSVTSLSGNLISAVGEFQYGNQPGYAGYFSGVLGFLTFGDYASTTSINMWIDMSRSWHGH